MSTNHHQEVLRVALRYIIAVIVGFITAVLALLTLGDGDDPVGNTKLMAFAAILVSAFCFPARTRWFHAAALLGFGIVVFCLLRPIDYRSYMWHGLPNFRSIVIGGTFAVLAHVLIDFLVFVVTWPNTALEPTGVGAGSSASRSTSQPAGGSAFGR